MKRKFNKGNNSNNIKINKKSGYLNSNINKNSLCNTYFNENKNRNKIFLILNFLDINEQLPLIKLNSIISRIIINKYNLPFKSVSLLRKYKNNKNVIDSNFSKIYGYFNKIIKENNIEEKEYDFIISFLLKNMNNNFLIFDKFNDDINKDIIFNILSKIQHIKNINHIKFIVPNADTIIEQSNFDENKKLCFINFFVNIKHLEINKTEKSLSFINQLLNYENNLINNIEKINLGNITIKIKDELSLKFDENNSLIFPKLTNLKYIFLTKINLCLSFLNLITNNNINLIKLIINNCSYYNNIENNNEKEKSEIINKNINNLVNLKHIEFINNNFNDDFVNIVINNLISLYYNQNNNIYLISCGFNPNNNYNSEEIYNNLIINSNKIINNDRYLNIKFSPSFIYHIKKNKNIIEITNYINDINKIKKIKYDKIKLCLYNTDNPSIINNIKKVMENYYIKDSTKYLQIYCSFKNGELDLNKNINNQYISIEKFTLFFQNEDENNSLYGNNIILSLLMFFPNIKIISFKNINFQNNDKKYRQDFDDFNISLSLMLFGKKNGILSHFKNKKINLQEIKFSNCSYYNNFIDKYILGEIESTLPSYFGKGIKLSIID